jgi:hypothetical protein
VGRFFNYGNPPTDDKNDAEAAIELVSDGTDASAPLRVQVSFKAADNSLWQTIGYVPLGQTARLRLKWDKPNKQFIFQLNRDPVVVMSYIMPDESLPMIPLKALWVPRGLPHCSAPPLGTVMIEAYFDNVYVNVP